MLKMNNTLELNGIVGIEGEQLVRDLKSKAVLSINRKALAESRQKRQQKQYDVDITLETKTEIVKINNDIRELKNELCEVKELLRGVLSQFIYTDKLN